MKKKIGFVAIGQAGGNIGKLFEDKGFSVLYLNTSQEDLQTLKNAKYTYHIAGGEGCNKDRAKAKRLVMEDFDNISKEIYEKMDVSMIYVVFAAGGGTGSGCGPMLIDLLLGDIAAGESKVESVGAITVIPSEKESPKTQINCYECFEELTAISSIASVMIIDNSKGDKLILNQHLVNVFYNFIEIPNRHKDERGNIDRAEIEETLKSKGMLIVTEIIGFFQVFDIIFLMIPPTSSGMSGARSIVMLFYEEAFTRFNKGYGAAMANILFLIILVITMIQMKLQKKWVYYG